MEDDLANRIAEKFEFVTERPSVEPPAFNCPIDRLEGFLAALRDDWGFDMLVDATAIDWEDRTPRFTVVYHLYSTGKHEYLRVAADCLDGENPEAPSMTGIWPAADWHERETYDMFGIKFTGHPNLKRILMWDEYPYFPLRKEFPLAGIETELPAADVAEETNAKVKAAPMMGGPFRSSQNGKMSESEPRARDESWTEEREKGE
jgi:NADH-quinone oxidoreductase subunit C